MYERVNNSLFLAPTVSPTTGVITDEEKAIDRLADENDAMELVNATTNMLSAHEEDMSVRVSPKISSRTGVYFERALLNDVFML